MNLKVLRTSPPVSVLTPQGLSDTTFSNDGLRFEIKTLMSLVTINLVTHVNIYYVCHDMLNRVLASNITGEITMWDRRVSDISQRIFTTGTTTGLTSIQLTKDQYVYGASRSGFIHLWDIRGGSSSTDVQSDKVEFYFYDFINFTNFGKRNFCSILTVTPGRYTLLL